MIIRVESMRKSALDVAQDALNGRNVLLTRYMHVETHVERHTDLEYQM
jgi:hypothetical protein